MTLSYPSSTLPLASSVPTVTVVPPFTNPVDRGLLPARTHQRGRADRSPAELTRRLVHGLLGFSPARLRFVQSQLPRHLAGIGEILYPHPDQTEPYPFQTGPLVQFARCDIDHTSEVGRTGQSSRSGDGREIRPA